MIKPATHLIYAALPVGEPVAYIDKRGRLLSYKDKPIPVDTLVYEAAAQALPAEELTDRLVAISSAVADSDDRKAQAMLSETLQLLAAARSQPVLEPLREITDEEIMALEKQTPAMNDAGEEWIYFARAVLKKAKE